MNGILKPKITDKQLAVLASNGDSDGFRQLLERHYDSVFRLAYRLCGHREEAEDITQDVCVILAKNIGNYRGEAAFRTWLYRVTVNRMKDTTRRVQTAKRGNAVFCELEALWKEEADQKQIEVAWLEEMMAKLPPHLSETAALVVGEGLSHAQAGAVLDVSEGTVSWRMSELKKALRVLAKEEA